MTLIYLSLCRVETVGNSDITGSDPGCDAERRQHQVLDDGGQAGVGQGQGRPAYAVGVQGPVD